MHGRFLLILLFIFSAPLLSIGQTYSDYTWYIGNRIVEFNRSTTVPTPANGVPLVGTAAVVADPANGDVLFYTDGQTIYDASNQPMPNGSGLTADPAGNQHVVVAAVPGSTTQYYVITNSTTGEIRMTIIDMSLAGNTSAIPLGNVGATKDVLVAPGLVGQSQAMLVVPVPDGSGFWLITHTEGSTTYNVTLFTSAGPVSTTTFSGVGLIESAGNFAYNATTGQIAVSPSEANRNVEILNFSAADGQMSFEASLPNSAVTSVTTQGIYDTEWSPNGQYLYVSKSGQDGLPDLLQYDISTLDPNNGVITPVSVLPQPSNITASYGLQIGPDSAIYHLYQANGQIQMGKITEPDNDAANVNYVPNAIPGNFTATQFPAFLESTPPTLAINFDVNGTCAGVPSQFFPTVNPSADSLEWRIDGQLVSSEWSPLYTFDQSGSYTVEVTAYLNGVPTKFTRNVTIQPFDTQITLEPEVTGCHSEFTEPRVKPPGWVPCGTAGGDPCLTVTAQVQGAQGTIRWFGPEGEITGNNTLTLTPPSPGFYYLVVGDGACFAHAGVNVKEYDVPDPRANVWYFGNGVGIDFNPLFREPAEPLAVISNGVMNAPQGTATISDRNGQVVLFTDGESVWVRDNPTPIATGIGGSQSSTQSSLIMGVPGDETLYYIFTTQEISSGGYELRYTLFDLKLNGGTGGIVDPDNNPGTNPPSTVLFTKSTERLIAVDNWIIVHEYGNNTFRAYEVTANGIGDPIYSNIGSDHSVVSPITGEGYMMYGSGRLAVALATPTGNKVEVFDFDEGTGEVSNPRTITVNAPGQVYGVNFSPNGDKMYVTLLNHPGEIFEFYYDDNLDTYVQMPAPIVMTGMTNSQPGAMQYGPDGTLYVAVEGANALASIDPREDQNTQSVFVPNATPPLNGTVTLGLPNFVQQIANPLQGPGIVAPSVCVNTESEFTATGKDSTIDQFIWEFSDIGVTADTGPSVVRTITTPGSYTVRVKIWNKCEGSPEAPYFDETVSFDVNDIPVLPPMLNGQSNIICDDTGITLLGSAATDTGGPFTYQWSNGATTPTIIATQPGQYSVTTTNRFGCTNQNSAILFPHFGDIDLGPDLTLCEGATQSLSVSVAGQNITYAWFENGVQLALPATQQVIPVNTSLVSPPALTYRVEVSDGLCTLSDEIVFQVSKTPVFSLNKLQDDTNCDPAINDGVVQLNITQPAGPQLSYNINGTTTYFQSGSDIVAPFSQDFGSLAADVYTGLVWDQVSGCASTVTTTVNNNTLAFTATQTGTCFPNIGIQVNVTAGTPTTYTIFDPAGQPIRSGNATPGTFITQNVPGPAGTYTIQLAGGGCQSAQQLTLQNTVTPFQVGISLADLCGLNQVQVQTSPAGATNFTWTATQQNGTGNGIVSTGGNSATLAVGTWVVNVTASGNDALACPGQGTAIVTVTPPLTPDFVQTNPCESPVVLNATQTGPNLVHDWLKNNVVVPPSGPSYTLSAVDDNATFQVRVTNNLSQCSALMVPGKTVRIIEPFTVDIVPPVPACEGSTFDITVTPSRTDVTQFQWFLNDAALSDTDNTLSENRGGVYKVIGILEGCQSPPDEEPIGLSPKPTVDLGPLKRICPFPDIIPDPNLNQASLTPGTDFTAYQWFKVNGNVLEDQLVTDPIFSAVEAGTYRVLVTDNIGCQNFDEVEVIEECDPIITGPNAFRPGSAVNGGNPDRDNGQFWVISHFITDEDFRVLIFNRWGQMVFESDDRNFLWNGGMNGNSGQGLPPGTYAYVIRYKSQYFPEQGIKEKRGGVVLIR